jgi:hypothetical protein
MAAIEEAATPIAGFSGLPVSEVVLHERGPAVLSDSEQYALADRRVAHIGCLVVPTRKGNDMLQMLTLADYARVKPPASGLQDQRKSCIPAITSASRSRKQ